MHSKSNEDYTIHFNGDFSRVIYIHNKIGIEKTIPPALFALLYSTIADDIRGKQDDFLSDLIWQQERMGAKEQSYWEAENATD